GEPRRGRAVAAPSSPDDDVASLVSHLEERGVLVLDRRAVLAYLRAHKDLLPVVRRVADVAVERLGDRCELSLEVYRDPESGGKTLFLFARQWPNEPGLRDEVDAIMDSFWALPPEGTGWFQMMVDRQRPRRR
ncbi:MAG TPA: hypothetical protein VFH48_23890, partial [Chloroflexota bacterium]|nr:hypothetical protein [Chloroflexota bacterium]